jgi:hypothetical protein
MTITSIAEYNQKVQNLNLIEIVMQEYEKKTPCLRYRSTTKGINQECLDYIWKNSYCDGPSPYTVENSSTKTLYELIKDVNDNSARSVNDPTRCHEDPNTAIENLMLSNYNVNNIIMNHFPKKTFIKSGDGNTVQTIDDCKNSCLPETGCISATYNSSSKKCWTNFGEFSEWKEPLTSTDDNDSAIYWQVVRLGNEKKVLEEEIDEYIRNVTESETISGNGSGAGSEANQTGMLGSALQSMNSSLGGSNSPPPPSVDTKDFNELNQKVIMIDTDRIATTKSLEDYKAQLIEMSNKQEDSNAKLKKELITIALIAVIGILLIFLLSAVVQSMNSSNSGGFSGGGVKKCGCFPLKVFPFNSILLKQIFMKLFKK